ncbi:MAG: aminotransferase class V-fold PLP-dependent enzyme [Gemmatimonadota bacterium]|jgi:cysteine desulfurase/selenocysteine lyase
MNVADVRGLFPGVSERIYLDLSLNALMPSPARDAVVAHLEERVMGRAVKEELHARAERVREGVARLLGAEPDEIAITKNVSEGLNLFAASLPWREGDNVVFCPELEHPNNVFLWYNLARNRGIEAREVPPVEGRIPVEGMVASMDDRTRVVTASHVTFSPGFVTDLRRLAGEAHARNARLLVDAAQSAGALVTDVHELGVDAAALGSQKALMALYGLGFLYVRRELADAMSPVFAGRYGVEMGADAHETAISDGAFDFKAGARRFELSNYDYAGLAAVEATLQLLLGIGMPAVEAHLRGLARRLASGLLELGLPVAGGEPGPHLAHVVAVGESGGGRHDSADDPAMNRLHRHLTDHGVRLSIRRGVLRMSLGIYNTEEEVDRVVALCRGWMRAEGRTAP